MYHVVDELAVEVVAHVGLQPVLHLRMHDLDHLDLLGVVVVSMERKHRWQELQVLVLLGKDDVYDLVLVVGLHLDRAAVGQALEIAFAEFRLGVEHLVHDAVTLVVVDEAAALGGAAEVVALLWHRPAAVNFHRFHRRSPLLDDLQWTYLKRDHLTMLMSHLVEEVAVELAVEEAASLLAC